MSYRRLTTTGARASRIAAPRWTRNRRGTNRELHRRASAPRRSARGSTARARPATASRRVRSAVRIQSPRRYRYRDSSDASRLDRQSRRPIHGIAPLRAFFSPFSRSSLNLTGHARPCGSGSNALLSRRSLIKAEGALRQTSAAASSG